MTFLYYIFVWILISLVHGDVFTVPTAFLARKHHAHRMIWESPLAIRGGDPKESRKDGDEDDEWGEVYDEDEEEEEEEMDVQEEPVEAMEEELLEAEEDEQLVEEEEEESPAIEEEEVAAVAEEVVAGEEEASFLEERVYTDDENSSSFVDRMEARIANTNTDDENSSAFVDRMELADAYDEVDVVTDQEEGNALDAVTAVAAASVIGGGDDGIQNDEEKDEGQDVPEEGTAVETLELSTATKDTLKGLKYKSREIDLLRPEVATELAEKGLQRPHEGIPQNWLVEGASIGVSIREQALKISVVLAALAGLAFVGAKGDIGDMIAGVPSVFKSLLPAKSVSMKESKSSLIADTGVTLVPGEVEEEGKEDDHPHSVKPNSTSPPAYEKDLDKSFLDKVITKIGNAFKAFWNAKI